MDLAAVLQTGGSIAVGTVLFWFVQQFIAGKIHSDSEVDGLRDDKKALILINSSQAEALRQANEVIRDMFVAFRGTGR